jgi:hypothetical protein
MGCGGPKKMTSVYQQVSDTVVFLFDEDGTTPVGTAFLIGYPAKTRKDAQFPLVVTAKHVIAGRSSVIARYSLKSGLGTQQVRYDLDDMKANNDFWEHDDDGVDVVVFRTPVVEQFAMRTIPIEFIASKEVFSKEDIKVTDRVMFPSLLVRFMGSSRNYPVTRDGTIALVPEEPVPLTIPYGDRIVNTMQEVIFVDGTAVQGASGSPVFLWPGPRIVSNSFKIGAYTPWLLGVIHGFYPTLPRGLVEVMPTEGTSAFMENSGIALVFPSWRLLEILESESLKKRIDELDRPKK